MAYPQAYPVQADPTAVFGRRVLAVVIDAALVLIPVVMLFTASFEYVDARDLDVGAEEFCDAYRAETGGECFDATEIDDRVYFTDQGSGASTALYWAATIMLLVVVQAFTGWTPGKLIVGIRCVQEDGRAPGIVKALVRWLLWIVDGFPYVIPGLVGFIVGLTTVGHRRVGDMAASTFVVGKASKGSPIVVPGLTAPLPPPPGAAAGAWGEPPGGASATTSAGWASPAPTPSTAPQWDEARGTYIQWDPTQQAWMQWDEANKAWSRIPGQ